MSPAAGAHASASTERTPAVSHAHRSLATRRLSPLPVVRGFKPKAGRRRLEEVAATSRSGSQRHGRRPDSLWTHTARAAVDETAALPAGRRPDAAGYADAGGARRDTRRLGPGDALKARRPSATHGAAPGAARVFRRGRGAGPLIRFPAVILPAGQAVPALRRGAADKQHHRPKAPGTRAAGAGETTAAVAAAGPLTDAPARSPSTRRGPRRCRGRRLSSTSTGSIRGAGVPGLAGWGAAALSLSSREGADSGGAQDREGRSRGFPRLPP
jgi:hypothetical protein